MTYRTSRTNPTYLYRRARARMISLRKRYWEHVTARNWDSQVLPTGAAVAITERCNLNCEYCARNTIPLAPDMTVDDYKRLLSKMWWNFDGINMIGLGEPLIHPNIAEVLNWTTEEKRFGCIISTNGMVNLGKPGLLEALLKVRQIQFSIDTVDAQKLKKIRTGADLSVIDRNLRLLLEARNSRGRVTPEVNINSVLTPDTLSGMTDVIEYAETLPQPGLSYLQFSSVSLQEYQTAHTPLIGSNANSGYQSLVQEARARAKRSSVRITGLDKILAPPTAWRQCRGIYNGIGFRPNGDIYMCCYRPDLKLGNGFTDDIVEAWNGSVARRFREQVLTDNPPDCCHTCAFAFEGHYQKWVPRKIPR